MDPALRKEFVLDAGKKGCTGMFWRSEPRMGATASASDWPRNGTVLHGWYVQEHPGWVRIDHPNGTECQ
ncbi:hypothetical protein JKP88DRAFT_170807 [Tribonema minus]|uniref:Uncharacterized protein n=1 Tax=Tribonema minus TaxID=303371 RepID=A0A835YKE7_9STRA|nr:hypothetical protein JKP88DRAFT_170807 [Tribonema minus]